MLIGDAAHSVAVGPGTSMAIEDAVVLARSLHEQPTVTATLTAFDRLWELVLPLVFPHVFPKATNWL